MIGYLTGKILDLGLKKIIVMTSGGVGYEVFPAGSLLAKCKKGGEFSAEIFTIVREQEITLYGFGNRDEKELFEKLIGISGIGPKTALGMISVPTDKFMVAVENGDTGFLTKLPGIGKKTAERLIIELRGKLDLTKDAKSNLPQSAAFTEAMEALKNLGYDTTTINQILSTAPEKSTAEQLVRFFLSSNA